MHEGASPAPTWGPAPGPASGPGSGYGSGGYPAPPPGRAPGYGAAPYPQPDLLGAQQSGDRARSALWFGLAASVLQTVCSMIVLASFSETFSTMMDDARAGRRTSSATVATDPLTLVANLLSNVLALVLLIVGILFLVWFHKALTNARSLGLRLTRSPGWGVAGFFVPIVNFWFPYQSMRDLFPPSHPARSRVGRWWATYLGAGFLSTGGFFGALIAPAIGWVLLLGAAALYVVAALTARELIAASLEAHRDLAAAGAWSPGAPGAIGPLAPYPGSTAPYPTTPGPPTGWAPAPAAPPKDPWSRN